MAGGLSTGIHHLGVGFSELLEEAKLVLANGSLITVVPGQELMEYIAGSAGTLGLIVEVVLATEPRRAFEWQASRHTWADEDGLAALVAEWQANETLQSILWLAPAKRAATLQTMTRGPPLAPPTAAQAAEATARPYKLANVYGSAALAYSVHLALWHLAVSLAEPLVRTLAKAIAGAEIQATIDQYIQDEVSTPQSVVEQHSELDTLKSSTQFSTTELGLSVDAEVLRPCVLALSRAPYPMALHMRHAQRTELPLVSSGSGVYHLDVSISEPILALLSDTLRDASAACPPTMRDGFVVSHGHAGKNQLASASERRPWRAPLRAQQLPGSSMSPAHLRFRELKAELDPQGKFAPRQ